MRVFPFLGFVNTDKDSELAQMLEVPSGHTYHVFLFEWLDFLVVFFAYEKEKA